MFETYLEKYAALAIKIGVNVQPGQRLLIINAPPETAPFIRALTKAAYQAGARYVGVLWQDEHLGLIRLQHGSRESLSEFPTWTVDAMRQVAEEGGAHLSISARTPDILSGQDPEALKIIQQAANQHMQPISQLVMNVAMNWSVAGAVVPGWAAKVFPDVPVEQAIAQLWDAIFDACRVKEADPVAAWEQHIITMQRRGDYLTHKGYTALHYRAAGTDLMVGLPAGHRWISGRVTAGNGIPCVPNLPTEEIFTLPHRERVDGIVTSTKPLVYQGVSIENLTLKFENGKVIEAHADKGETDLNNLIQVDDGAARLGEVALVAHSSPISKLGFLFHSMLYDENASCHLALGRAYKIALDGKLDDAAFTAAGGNNSLIHADFMIGSAQMDIDGIRADGEREPIFRAGEWVI